ncbi:unnamed protein product, partial [Effrenium voratum]
EVIFDDLPGHFCVMAVPPVALSHLTERGARPGDGVRAGVPSGTRRGGRGDRR